MTEFGKKYQKLAVNFLFQCSQFRKTLNQIEFVNFCENLFYFLQNCRNLSKNCKADFVKKNYIKLNNIFAKLTSKKLSKIKSLDFLSKFSDFQDPYAVVVLLQNDLVVIDLMTGGFPCFENPYPMDLHESPVTCCAYFADCPSDLVPAFYSVGSKAQKKTGFSEREWPMTGGEWSPNSSSYNEIILTG